MTTGSVKYTGSVMRASQFSRVPSALTVKRSSMTDASLWGVPRSSDEAPADIGCTHHQRVALPAADGMAHARMIPPRAGVDVRHLDDADAVPFLQQQDQVVTLRERNSIG